MKIINLDKNFAPLGEGIPFSSFMFPSECEVNIKLPEINDNSVLITTRIRSSNDIMMLLLATDAVKRLGIKDIDVFIPYLPYARQDRKMVDGEALSLKVMADLLNAQEYKKVTMYDVHSEVATALINNSESITNHKFAKEVLKDKKDYYIVSPDAGAYKKIFKLCQYLNYQEEIIMSNKIRDVSNGVIRSMTISHSDLKGKECFIVDDICDGGGTFSLLAQELRSINAGKINLIVSHGIFSRGFSLLTDINHIYTTDSFKDNELIGLTQFKLNHGLLLK